MYEALEICEPLEDKKNAKKTMSGILNDVSNVAFIPFNLLPLLERSLYFSLNLLLFTFYLGLLKKCSGFYISFFQNNYY